MQVCPMQPRDHRELVDAETVLGRDPLCTVPLPVATVSRRHARILRFGQTYFLEDLQSRNGTYLNGKRLTVPQELHAQDQIELDVVLLIFEGGPHPGEARLFAADAPDANRLHSRPAAPPLPGDPVARSVPTLPPCACEPAEQPCAAPHALQVTPAAVRGVFEIVQGLGSVLDANELLPRILNTAFGMFPQAAQGSVLLPGAGGRLEPHALQHRDRDVTSGPTLGRVSQSLARRVFQEGRASLGTELNADRHSELSESALELGIESLIGAPLLGPAGQVLGVIQLESREPRQPFAEQDLNPLSLLGILAGQALAFSREHARLTVPGGARPRS